MKGPSLTTVVNGNNKTLYMPNIPSIEQATKKNLKEKLTGMFSSCDLTVGYDVIYPNDE